MEPFNTLNADGDITELYEQYPMMIRLFAVGNKPKIVRAGYFLLAELIHLVDNRPDILPQHAESCTSLNEVFIEHNHSILARLLDKAKKEFQILRNLSVQISQDRQRKTSMLELLQRGDDGPLKKKARVAERSRGDSEVKIQVTRFRKGGSCFPQVQMVADNWLIPLIKSYASMNLTEEQAELFESYDPMDWDNVRGELRFQMIKLDQYIIKLRNSIEKLSVVASNRAGDAPVAAIRLFPVIPVNILSLFIWAQNIDTLKLIIKKVLAVDCPPAYSYIRAFFTREDVVGQGIGDPFVKQGRLISLKEYTKNGTKSPKENQVCAVYYLFTIAPPNGGGIILNDDSSSSLAVLKLFLTLKNVRIDHKKVKITATSAPTSAKKMNFVEAYQAVPIEKKCVEFISILPWDKKNDFPLKKSNEEG